ncbi:MAG: sulfatase [Rhodothermales bacterium]
MSKSLSRLVPALWLLLMAGCEAPGPAASPPNILFAIADDVSFPHMGAYGTDWVRTPAFDRVARDGLLFMRAYTPNAKCAPSRSAILTGRNSWQLEAAANHWPYFPEGYGTYVEALAANGYHAGYTAKGWAPGVARDAEGQVRRLTGTPYNERKLTPPASGIGDIDYAENFRAFLDDRPADQPFVFWYGGLEPHRGYEFGSGEAKGGKSKDEIDAVPAFWPDIDSVRTDMLDYAFEIEHFDTHLQRMLDLLDERGELENTLVVVTADNGMPFPRVKGQSYEFSNHLPLAIMWPAGIRQTGRRIDTFVSFIDLAPTFLDAAGVDLAGAPMRPIQGKSLMPLLRDEAGATHRDHVLIGKERHDIGRPGDVGYPMRGIVRDGWLYIRNYAPDRWPAGNPETGYLNCDGSPTKTVCLDRRRAPDEARYWQWSFGFRPGEELYDIANDPECLSNRADDPSVAALKSELETLLVAELTAEGDPRMRGEGAVFDAYPYADEKHQHFYERYRAGEPLEAGWVNASDFEAID